MQLAQLAATTDPGIPPFDFPTSFLGGGFSLADATSTFVSNPYEVIDSSCTPYTTDIVEYCITATIAAHTCDKPGFSTTKLTSTLGSTRTLSLVSATTGSLGACAESSSYTSPWWASYTTHSSVKSTQSLSPHSTTKPWTITSHTATSPSSGTSQSSTSTSFPVTAGSNRVRSAPEARILAMSLAFAITVMAVFG
ncbi:hypothetical protein JX266_014013 [Neoarthrinium moseri]|nr:hypothetical protein JX266_014013 [Neoarthrinium moseri]